MRKLRKGELNALRHACDLWYGRVSTDDISGIQERTIRNLEELGLVKVGWVLGYWVWFTVTPAGREVLEASRGK